MKNPVVSILFCLLLSFSGFSQENLRSTVKKFNSWSEGIAMHQGFQLPQCSHPKATTPLETGVSQLLKTREYPGRFSQKIHSTDSVSLGDTLLIGAFPGDSIVITGSWFHSGPIVIINDGYLGFKQASATIIGDVFVAGSHARLDIDSSLMYFPQAFFYQRTLLLAGNAKLNVRNSTLDYSGLSHNLVATDSAGVHMENITYVGFTTNGFYRHARIEMNGCNQAGEYVITDTCNLSFSNVNTLLLWHQIPDQASLYIDFPDGTVVNQYQFLPNQPGAAGLHYTVEVNASEKVWWALMPSGGSDVVIENSEIRAIGLWFEGNDTVAVNGLVNNSTYTSFTAGLSDRNLQLNNSSVMTWSLYPMDDSYIQVQSCILGEIGTMNRSRCELTSVFADGSGGYVWAVDTTMLFMAFSSLSSSIRSDRNGILLLAYNAVTNGQIQAQGNSILMILQSTLSQPPVLLDKACIWTARIDPPQQAFAGLTIPVSGTASIQKTSTSNLMDFYAYRLWYRKEPDTAWTPMGSLHLMPETDDTLEYWNTQGFIPGAYSLKLELFDNSPDTNGVEVIAAINLLPLFMNNVKPSGRSGIRICPNPAQDVIQLVDMPLPSDKFRIRILAADGRVIREQWINPAENISISNLRPGLYLLDCPDSGIKPLRFVKL